VTVEDRRCLQMPLILDPMITAGLLATFDDFPKNLVEPQAHQG
jgi:hypothetical protein